MNLGDDVYDVTITWVKLDTMGRTVPETPEEFFILQIKDSEGNNVLL